MLLLYIRPLQSLKALALIHLEFNLIVVAAGDVDAVGEALQIRATINTMIVYLHIMSMYTK